MTGVYQTGPVAGHSLGADVPVATFGTLLKRPEHRLWQAAAGRSLVTAVTVRGTHRRRGLLRRMMTEDLAAARQDGLAMAALTASEGVDLRPVRLRRGDLRAIHQGGHQATIQAEPHSRREGRSG